MQNLSGSDFYCFQTADNQRNNAVFFGENSYDVPIQATSYLPKPLQRLFYVLTAPGQILTFANRQFQGRGFEASFRNAKMDFQKVCKNSIFSYPISISVTIVMYDVVVVHGL